MTTEFGCEVTIDISKLEHVPEESCYSNNWYKGDHVYFFVHSMEEYDQVDIYFSKTLGGSKTFPMSAYHNYDGVYSGELGDQWPWPTRKLNLKVGYKSNYIE